MSLIRPLEKLVLPELVAPEMRMFLRLSTARRKNSGHCPASRSRSNSPFTASLSPGARTSLKSPARSKSPMSIASEEALRIVIEICPRSTAGGTTTWTRAPSGKTEEQIGYSPLMSCLVRPAMSRASVMSEPESRSATLCHSHTCRVSMPISPGRLMTSSVTSARARNGASGPAYSMETWEEIALRLASQAGIVTPIHELIDVAGKKVMLSRRFDRQDTTRIPFLSAMAMMGAKDGERSSYPEIVDALAEYGAQGKTDAHALYRRVAFNVLVSNVDDHLRNHGFLWLGRAGWSLSPVYDLNPVPTDLKARVLTTNIDLDEGTCSIDLLEAASEYFGLGLVAARGIIKEVAVVTATWRETAKDAGAKSAEITRMASAFEHDDLKRAMSL